MFNCNIMYTAVGVTVTDLDAACCMHLGSNAMLATEGLHAVTTEVLD